MFTKYVRELDFVTVCDGYLLRKRIHQQLRKLYDDNKIEEYVELALGKTTADGNHSASKHPGLCDKIIYQNGHQRVFNLAATFDELSNAAELPNAILDADLDNLKISVGSEMAMMLRPDTFWVANKRTTWAHLLLKHDDIAKAKEELVGYNDNDPNSGMAYKLWPKLYPELEATMLQLSNVATVIAKEKRVTPGRLKYLWPDGVAGHLFGHYIG